MEQPHDIDFFYQSASNLRHIHVESEVSPSGRVKCDYLMGRANGSDKEGGNRLRTASHCGHHGKHCIHS